MRFPGVRLGERGQGQRHAEPVRGIGRSLRGALVGGGDCGDDREAEARSGTVVWRRRGAIEAIEDAWQRGGLDAGSLIAYLYRDQVAATDATGSRIASLLAAADISPRELEDEMWISCEFRVNAA